MFVCLLFGTFILKACSHSRYGHIPHTHMTCVVRSPKVKTLQFHYTCTCNQNVLRTQPSGTCLICICCAKSFIYNPWLLNSYCESARDLCHNVITVKHTCRIPHQLHIADLRSEAMLYTSRDKFLLFIFIVLLQLLPRTAGKYKHTCIVSNKYFFVH